MRRASFFLLTIGMAIAVSAAISGCANATAAASPASEELRYSFPNILDVSYSPDTIHRCEGWFTDAGSWIGFTAPERGKWTNGFCGPFSLDMNRRQWLAKCAVAITPRNGGEIKGDTVCYYPGELSMATTYEAGSIRQTLNFIDANTVLLRVDSEVDGELGICGLDWGSDVSVSSRGTTVIAGHPSGETFMITFPGETRPEVANNNYHMSLPGKGQYAIVMNFFPELEDAEARMESVGRLSENPAEGLMSNGKRWEGYLKSVLREDMPDDYDRIAVKAITTLVSNHRVARGGLLHDGIIPSHAVGYFVGLWAWDSWRFSAGAAEFDPELAKDNIRAMFDYQMPDGMVIDCIYTDPSENNSRDSKPPLVCWAVDKIYAATADKDFLAEMYPQLLAYYNWWFAKRDIDGNGMCEYGSTDGTLEAAAWESGMDNAIRFDDVEMIRNAKYDNAWSMNQESVDLNAYLAQECTLLKKFAGILGERFDAPDNSGRIADYFYDSGRRFFFDRSLADRSPVGDPGCEAYTMLWTGLATPHQVAEMLPTLQDSTKFSTYIPFPTIAADNPKYNPRGYWRGPIWLDQTYFAISGLRRYGYSDLADEYTRRVFDRLDGLKETAPIHENYDTHTGHRLKAPHFSWSASHLIMLYKEYGKKE